MQIQIQTEKDKYKYPPLAADHCASSEGHPAAALLSPPETITSLIFLPRIWFQYVKVVYLPCLQYVLSAMTFMRLSNEGKISDSERLVTRLRKCLNDIDERLSQENLLLSFCSPINAAYLNC